MSHLSKTSHHNGQMYEQVLPPDEEALVSIQLQSHAVFELFHDSDPSRKMDLYSDELGWVRFHLRIPSNANPLELNVRRTDSSGEAVAHKLKLLVDPNQWPSSGRRVRDTQGSSAKSLASMTDTELVARGYPPRPPMKARAAHTRWRRLVSQKYTAVNPHLVKRSKRISALKAVHDKMSPTLPLPPPSPELSRAAADLIARSLPRLRNFRESIFNTQYNNWCGVIVTKPVNAFYTLQADWTQPTIFPAPTSIARAEASLWAGFDNSPVDLFQAGTDAVTVNFPVGFPNDVFGYATATNYYLWIEALPDGPWYVPNFPVSPGDEISVNIFVADGHGQTWFANDGLGGGLTAQNDSVWFMIYNTTQGKSYWGTYPRNTLLHGFSGSSVEFVVERPTDNDSGTLDQFANFGTARLRNCWFGDAQFGGRYEDKLTPDDGSQPFDGQLTYLNMADSSTGHVLATATSCNNADGGDDIFLLWANYN